MNHKDENSLSVGFVFELDLDEFRRPRKLKVEAEPHEAEAVQASIETALRGLAQLPSEIRVVAGPSLPFGEALAEYYAKADIKASSKATYRSRLAFAQDHFGQDGNVLQIGQGEFRCLVLRCAGVIYSQLRRDELWDRYSTDAPARQRQCVERYNIVKRA